METAVSPSFNAYHKWLGIRDPGAPGSPPNHYRLLGLELWESDADVIRDAAWRQIQHVRNFRTGPHRDVCQKILVELEEARETLLNPLLRRPYDRQLRLSLDDGAARPAANGRGHAPGGADAPARSATVQCPRCGADSPAARQFCAACGARLWEPCIQCGVPSGPEEQHCGACGVNLAAAVQQHVERLQARIQEAQSLRNQCLYGQAIDALQECTFRDHPRLEDLRQRAERMLDKLTVEATNLEQLKTSAIPEAQTHLAKCDYERAIEVLLNVPEAFRTDPMRQLLEEARARQAEALSLDAEIRQAAQENKLDGLLPQVERLLQLKPDHAEAQQLAAVLRPKEARKIAARNDQLARLAVKELDRHDYAAAVKLLMQIDEQLRSPNVIKLLQKATVLFDESAWLMADLRGAVAYDPHLLPIAERLVKLLPEDKAVQQMAARLRQLEALPPAQRRKIKDTWPAAPPVCPAGYPIAVIDRFERIGTSGNETTESAVSWTDYCVAAGLALQALEKSYLRTNLAPAEKGGLLTRLKSKKRSTGAAWGIDLGSCGIKAIKLVHKADEDRVVVDAVDYVGLDETRRGLAHFAKSAEQNVPVPLALNAEKPACASSDLLAGALDTFLGRNELKDCAVAVGLPGEKLLMRFFSLPLAEKKKIAEIMHYEVKQQIPLPVETVTWDYEAIDILPGPDEADAIGEHAIALFACKTEEIAGHLKPLAEKNVRLDVVQSNCAALLNFLAYERFPTSSAMQPAAAGTVGVTALLDIGAEISNLVVTNGLTMWMRCIPVGGNHFTRALAKEYDLPYEKAERLKRKPTAAPLLHRSYRAMQPCMHSLATQVQRSIDQYVTQDRRQVMQRLLVAGGGLKLHGLLKYLWRGE